MSRHVRVSHLLMSSCLFLVTCGSYSSVLRVRFWVFVNIVYHVVSHLIYLLSTLTRVKQLQCTFISSVAHKFWQQRKFCSVSYVSWPEHILHSLFALIRIHFTARRKASFVSAVYATANLSVRLLSRRYCVKTRECRETFAHSASAHTA